MVEIPKNGKREVKTLSIAEVQKIGLSIKANSSGAGQTGWLMLSIPLSQSSYIILVSSLPK